MSLHLRFGRFQFDTSRGGMFLQFGCHVLLIQRDPQRLFEGCASDACRVFYVGNLGVMYERLRAFAFA